MRRHREGAGFSQEELAERAGLSKNAIGALERGERRRPHPDTLRRLADALGLTQADRTGLTATTRSRSEPSATVESDAPSTCALPEHMERLIGRECQGQDVLHMLGQPEVRLLTLTGPGGVGKTRFAVEAARRAFGLFPDGVAFVPLAPLNDPTFVIPTVVHALGLGEAGGHTPGKILQSYLREREMLLVLDNFEHVLDSAPQVSELLLACPHLKVLATSRERLRLQGEQEYPVPPLALPDLSRVRLIEDVAQEAASVQLFVRRARQASPSLEFTPSNLRSIAAICRKLDGLPLAIELAAARVKLLPPTELLQRLDRSLPLLTGGARDLPARQQTMRDAIAWSYDLLDEREQTLFRRLSAFAGGWTLEAAEVVGAGGAGQGGSMLEILGRLLDQSLVLAEPTSKGSSRYRMLEPVRQYAGELLGESAEAAEASQRHASYYLGMAERAEPELGVVEQVALLDSLQAEHGNLRAALQWFEDEGDVLSLLRMTACLGWFWLWRGHWSEGRIRLSRALRGYEDSEQGATTPYIIPRAKALYHLASLVHVQGDYSDVRSLFEESARMWREVGDNPSLAQTLHMLGEVLWSYGDAEGIRSLNEEAAILFREAGDARGLARALRGLGKAAILAEEHDLARSLLEESMDLSRAAGDEWGIAITLHDLSRVALLQSAPARARLDSEKSLSRFERLGDKKGIIISLHHLGLAAMMAGEHERASALHERALRLCAEVGDRRFLARSLIALANVARTRGLHGRAARLLGAVDTLTEGISPPARQPERTENEMIVAWVRAELGEERFASAWAEGRTMSWQEAVEYALSGR